MHPIRPSNSLPSVLGEALNLSKNRLAFHQQLSSNSSMVDDNHHRCLCDSSSCPILDVPKDLEDQEIVKNRLPLHRKSSGYSSMDEDSHLGSLCNTPFFFGARLPEIPEDLENLEIGMDPKNRLPLHRKSLGYSSVSGESLHGNLHDTSFHPDIRLDDISEDWKKITIL